MDEPALTIRGDVGPVTGDVDHDGDVRITGSVMSGRQVRAGGKLSVRGNVRNSFLSAENEIVVEGHVSGAEAVLDAGHDVAVRHVSDARVVAGRDIRIGTVAERSTLFAGRRIRFVSPPGLLRGGEARATEGLEVARLEPTGGVMPVIRIGEPPFDETVEELRERITFARDRSDTVLVRTDAPLAEYRRHSSAAAIYRNLAATLARRLRQVETAAAVEEGPWLKVTGGGPIFAEVTLGEVEEAFPGIGTPAAGGFLATVVDGEVRLSTLDGEETRDAG